MAERQLLVLPSEETRPRCGFDPRPGDVSPVDPPPGDLMMTVPEAHAAAATPPTVVQALSAVMADVREVRKDQRNTAPGQGGYAFRGIDAVMNAVGPALRVHGVVVMPRVVSCEQSSIEVGQN